MPATEPIQGGPYPKPSDPPDGPNQMAALAVWAAGRLVMRFASPAARDAAITSPVEDMIAITGTGATQVLWLRGATTWRSVLAAGAWTAPTLLNSWVNSGGVFQVAGYRQSVNGDVELRGFIKAGPMNQAIFVLPAGMRPTATEVFMVQADNAAGQLSVSTAGNVSVTNYGTGASNAYVSLSGIRFSTL